MTKVKACWDSTWCGIPCLESEKEFAFFNDYNDYRPSSCTWIPKTMKFKDVNKVIDMQVQFKVLQYREHIKEHQERRGEK